MSLLRDLEEYGWSAEEVKGAIKEEGDRRRKAAYYLANYWPFFRDVLTPPELRPDLAPIHERLSSFFEPNRFRKKLALLPRGHLKTAVITQGKAFHRAVRDPNIRVLLSSSVWDNSKSFLGAIKGHCQNEQVQAYYGLLLPEGGDRYRKNNEEVLTLRTRSNMTLREATFSTTGVDKTKTSQHCDLLIHDDLHDDKNSTSEEQINTVISYFQDVDPLLDPGKELWILGTRWHPLDVYGWAIDQFCDPRCVEQEFVHHPFCTCSMDVMTEELETNGVYIFPARFNAEIAKDLERTQGKVKFARQYRNIAVAEETLWFPTAKVESAEIDPQEIFKLRNEKKLVWYMTCDPAESEEARSSYTAVVCVGVDPTTGIWYVDYAKMARVATPAFVQLAFSSWDAYHPSRFGMEQTTRKALAYALKDYMVLQNQFFTIDELKPAIKGVGGHGKEIRIKSLVPLFEHGRIRINRQLKDLLAELYTLPSSRHRDLADALAYQFQLIPRGMGRKEQGALRKRLPRRISHWNRTGL